MDYSAATISQFRHNANKYFKRTGYHIDLDNYPFKRKELYLYIEFANLWIIDNGSTHVNLQKDDDFRRYFPFDHAIYREHTLEEYLSNRGYSVADLTNRLLLKK